MSNPEIYKLVNLSEDEYKIKREELLFQGGYNKGIINGLKFHHKLLQVDEIRKRYLKYKTFVNSESKENNGM